MSALTQAELKRQLSYNSETGEFRWLVAKSGAKCGDAAGWKHPLGYIHIGLNRAIYKAHRLAHLYITGDWPPGDMDHINGVRDDNRWCNLRAVSRADNARNACIPSHNTSGVVGVSWYKRDGTWQASIKVDKQAHNLGRYDNLADAIAARAAAEIAFGFHKNHGRPA